MKKPRILVVESARAYQNVLRELGAQVGAECVFVDQLDSALVRAEQEEFDLFVAATYLPDGEGVELARACRTSPRHSSVPILLITSDDPADLAAKVIPMGVTELVRRADLPTLRRHFAECAARWSAAADARVLVLASATHAAMPYADILRNAGLAVVDLTDPAAALAEIERGGFDLIINEMSLAAPMTCLAFIRQVRGKSIGNDIVPVLVVANLDDMAQRLECMRAGANDFFNPPYVAEELVARALTLVAGKRRTEQLRAAIAAVPNERAPTQQLEDTLTGVHSRAFFDHLGPMAISAAERHGYPIAVVLFDIDALERVNETKGRNFGDRVIAAVGNVIMSSCRREDIVARYDGDRFAVILPFCDLSSALLKCERVRAKIAALRTDGLSVTVSAGIAGMAVDVARALDALLTGADISLQVAKANGRNRVVTEPEAERKAANAARIALQKGIAAIDG